MRVFCILLLALQTGCAFSITGEGAQMVIGQATTTTCPDGLPPEGGAIECSHTQGGSLSENTSSIIGMVLGILGQIGGVGR